MQLDEIADRLAEERLRLQFNKAAFARLLSISTEGLRLIEAGQSEFKLSVLVHAAAVGVDVQYVVTGVRSLNSSAVLEKVGYAGPVVQGNIESGVGVVQSGASVQIINTFSSSERKSRKTHSHAEPGTKHISMSQRATLKQLVEQVTSLEGKVNLDRAKSQRSIWAALNRHCSVPTYTLIEAIHYDKAEAFLRLWLGKLKDESNSGGRAKD